MLEPLNLFYGAIPIRVAKEPCHISKVHNDKVCLTFLFPDTGPSPDNLLKGSHALNRLVQNDQLCHLAVCSGGKQFGCRSDNRIRAGHGDEIVKFGFSVNIRTGDSNTVVRIFLDHISVMVDKGDSHALGMIFGSAEHNSFLHPVGAFQILGNLPCNLVNTVLENDIVIIIPIVIDSVFEHIAVYIGLPFVRPPAVTDVGRDIDNLERSKKSILDTLFQAISIDRISKIIDIRYLFALLWCRSHANLCSRRKVLQHFSPVTILLGTSTMTLVHNNEVKVFCGNLFEVFFIILPDHLMIEGKVYFMGCDLAQTFFVGKIHFVNGFFKWCKVLQNTLVNKNISVSQIQDSLFKVRTKQTIHDLESSICFACARCHNKQQSLLTSGNRFNSSIYCISLIVSGWICTLRRIIRLRDNFLFCIGNALAAIQLSVIPRHQFVLGREFI